MQAHLCTVTSNKYVTESNCKQMTPILGGGIFSPSLEFPLCYANFTSSASYSHSPCNNNIYSNNTWLLSNFRFLSHLVSALLNVCCFGIHFSQKRKDYFPRLIYFLIFSLVLSSYHNSYSQV